MNLDRILQECMPNATQVRAEFVDLLKTVGDLQISNFMEIGTDRGGTFRAFLQVTSSAGVHISLDLPRQGHWGQFDLHALHRAMLTWSPGVRLIHADSHALSTLDAVSRILRAEQLDFLFIDGDHSYEGVKQDFELYAPLVRRGGLVAFHDIVDSPEHQKKGCNVSRFWKELTGQKSEIVHDGSWGGIGLWWQQDADDQF